MRIASRWAWLGVATALPSLVAGAATVSFQFNQRQNLRTLENGTTLNIINVGGGNLAGSSTLVVDWTASDGTNLPLMIKLRAYHVADGTAEDIKSARVNNLEVVTMTVTPEGGGQPFFSTGTRRTLPTNFPVPGKRSDINKAAAGAFADVQLKVSMKSQTTGTVEISNIDELLGASPRGLPFFLEADFVEGTGAASLSPAFAVLEKSDPLPQWTSEFFTSPDQPFPSDKIKPSASGAALTPSNSASSGEGSSGGLATGAIAGIAVGAAVVVLAILGAIAWFFLRRRKQARDDDTLDTYRNGRTRTDELMAEKEANGGVDASPHSPYSDDGGQRDSSSLRHIGAGTGVAAAAIVGHHKKDLSQSTQAAHDAPRSFTPYSDHHDAIARSPSTHVASVVAASSMSHGMPDSPIPGRATPHGVPTPYAHLVEEGMTEDEIRRLEDEERALDAAIEQSAVKRT